MIKFAITNKVKGIPFSKKVIDNLKGIMNNKTHIHHFVFLGNIIGYVHSYCNYKVRENKSEISVAAHNLFRLKGLRAGMWRTRDLNIGGKNPTNMHFPYIGNHVMFLERIKYFQQSLGTSASNLTGSEKIAIRTEC